MQQNNVDFKLSGKNLGKKVLAFLFFLIIGSIAFTSCHIVNNRLQDFDISKKAYMSLNENLITFSNKTEGKFKEKDNVSFFTYSYVNGFILCKSEDTILLEIMVQSEEKLMEVKSNEAYYVTNIFVY